MALLKAINRGAAGSRKMRALRAEGKIPGIIYGHGLTPQSVTFEKLDVESAVKRGDRLLEVELEGTRQNVLVKEVQLDHMGSDILHLDLARVDLDEMVEVTVPVMLRGTPVGAVEGGVLQQNIAQVTIECMVRSIPDEIRASVSEMKVGDKLLLKELQLPEGAKLKMDGELLVATVSIIAEVEVEPTEEAVAAPEVIGAKEEEGEGEGEAAPDAKPKEKDKEKK